MAAPYPQPQWTNSEKNYLLAEIIKSLNPSPNVLLSLLTNIPGYSNFSWADIPLPPGRSLNSCRQAFNEIMSRAPSMQPIPIMPAMGPQVTSPMSAPVSTKRPYPFEGAGSFSAGREIRPKPTMINVPFGQQSPLEQPPRKKRGRPTKAEAQARAEASSNTGEPGPAPRPQTIETPIAQPSTIQPLEPPSIETPSLEPSRTEELRPPSIPTVRGVPIASLMTPTGQQGGSQSSSSSGKRRRGRSTRSEPEDVVSGEASSSRPPQEYESPYARIATDAPQELQDSPARTAVLRHRDETDPRIPFPSVQQTGGAQDPPSTTAPTMTGST